MDLTLESVFSVGGFVGHFAYLLLVVSMLMRTLFWLRIMVVASAMTAVAYAGIWLRDPVSLFWESALILVNLVQIALEWRAKRRARFNDEEQQLLDRRFPGLGRHEARRLLNLGEWGELLPGARITTEGQPVTHLLFIQAGTVEVRVEGHRVATCVAGNFVGEMSLVDGARASATTLVETPVRFWRIPTPVVLRLRTAQPRLSAAIELGIAQDLTAKIVAANARRAGDMPGPVPLVG